MGASDDDDDDDDGTICPHAIPPSENRRSLNPSKKSSFRKGPFLTAF